MTEQEVINQIKAQLRLTKNEIEDAKRIMYNNNRHSSTSTKSKQSEIIANGNVIIDVKDGIIRFRENNKNNYITLNPAFRNIYNTNEIHFDNGILAGITDEIIENEGGKYLALSSILRS